MTGTSTAATNDIIRRRSVLSSATRKSKQGDKGNNDSITQPGLSSSPKSSTDSISSLVKPAAKTFNSSTSTSTSTSTNGQKKYTKAVEPIKTKKFQSLKERSKSPPSFYISMFLIFSILYFNGILYQLSQVMESLQHSLSKSASTSVDLVRYSVSLLFLGKCKETGEDKEIDFVQSYIKALTMTVLVLCIIYVLIYSPLKAGMWTNTQRVKRHKVHRYFGLSFLILYGLAWVEFLNDYDGSYQQSFLPILISLNGKYIHKFQVFP